MVWGWRVFVMAFKELVITVSLSLKKILILNFLFLERQRSVITIWLQYFQMISIQLPDIFRGVKGYLV
jgi:hypothetical protein